MKAHISIIMVIIMMTISLVIALLVKKEEKINFDPKSDKYLFVDHKSILSIFSNIGTYFSISIYCAGGFIIGYIYGFYSVISLIISYIVAGITLYYATKKHPKFLRHNERKIMSAFVGDVLQIETQIVLVILIIIYAIAIIGAEIFIFKQYLIEVSSLSIAQANILAFSLLLCCYYYTREGGYLGVLKTDMFQAIVFIIWVAISVILIFIYHETVIQKMTGDIFSSGETAKGYVDCYIFKLFKNPFVIIVGLSIYLLTLILSCISIWIKIFGTLEKDEKRTEVAVISIVSLLVLSLIPVGLGAYYNGYDTKYDLFQIVLVILKNVTLGQPLYLYFTTFAFAAISITTIDSSLMTSLQNVNRLNRKKDPTFMNQIIDQRILLFPIMILGGTISIYITYKYLFTALMLVYNTLLFAFLIIVSALFKAKTNQSKKRFFKILKFFVEWDNIKSISAFLATIVIYVLLISLWSEARMFAIKNIHIVPIVFCSTFLLVNIITRVIWRDKSD